MKRYIGGNMLVLYLSLIDDENDQEKFEKLYNKYVSFLYKIAVKKLNDSYDAEDCVQETFFYIAKNFEKVGDIDSVSTKCYLATITTGFAINKFKSTNRVETITIEDAEESDRYKDSILDFEKYDAIEISALIDKLNETSRIYMYLTYYFGYTSVEIAKMYSTNEATVRQILSRARKQLKEYLVRG